MLWNCLESLIQLDANSLNIIVFICQQILCSLNSLLIVIYLILQNLHSFSETVQLFVKLVLYVFKLGKFCIIIMTDFFLLQNKAF